MFYKLFKFLDPLTQLKDGGIHSCRKELMIRYLNNPNQRVNKTYYLAKLRPALQYDKANEVYLRPYITFKITQIKNPILQQLPKNRALLQTSLQTGDT